MAEDNLITNQTLEERNLEFEKYKFRIEVIKWFIGSVALVLVTTIIDWGFRDRTAGLQEVQQYDKYVTDLIVLNKDLGQKRMLAQFFSNVTPSNKLKDGWKDYYKEVNKEYMISIAPVRNNDSISKVEYYKLADKKILTRDEKREMTRLDSQIQEDQRIINPAIRLPAIALAKYYDVADSWESKGFAFLFEKDVDNAILAFNNSENAYNSFHQVFEISAYLHKNRNELKDPKSSAWKTTYRDIATNYTWKLPPTLKAKLLDYAK